MTRRLRVLVTAVAAATAVALFAGCAAQEASGSDSGAGSSTAVLADEVIRPVAEAPAQQLPATVVSNDRGGDTLVTVTDTDRVLALDMSGSLAATVWGLGFGDRLVGRDVSTTFDGAADLPVVTVDGHSINGESVLDLKPSVVITDGAIGPRDVVEQLRDAGVTVVFIDRDASFEGAQDMAHRVAEVFGAPEAGDLLAQKIAADVASATAEVDSLAPAEAERPSMLFLYVRGSAGVYYIFGRESGASDLIEGLDGVDAAAEQGWTDMRPLTDEAMVAADPDVILMMTDGLKSVGGIDGLLEQKPAIALTSAGKNRRIVDMADGDILSFGPRSGDVLRALAKAVYAQDPS